MYVQKVVTTERVPIKLWLDDIEDKALKQAKNLANLPFVFRHIAIMPDAHPGYGMPIGGVMATKGVIVPNAVGVDIGCGVMALKTSLNGIDRKSLKEIMGKIRKVVPVGQGKHKEDQKERFMPYTSATQGVEDSRPASAQYPICFLEYQSALRSLGTLGGGNHFVEIQSGSDGHIWIMIHSGSRNLGYKVAKYYNELAIALNEKWHSSVATSIELAFLPYESNEGKAYLREMSYCAEFAMANRKLMMQRVVDSVGSVCDMDEIDTLGAIDVPHNYVTQENHFGRNVWIHRKGATLARKGTVGLIPGSQGSFSYIVEGKGNEDSFNSCSHGAGRKMGRKEATRTLDLTEELKKLKKIGVIHGIRHAQELDEAPGAYKDIETVMQNQVDLVDIKVQLRPLTVVKG